ncbi:MAG: DUF481 domain-containing protein, partial [Verrucomicrobia bacterium]|nr:DUF481 domain-containing protein [Verrucomicrobiota bacterium]
SPNRRALFPLGGALLICALFLPASSALSDTVTLVLKNGDRITGEPVQEGGGVLSLKHPALGVLRIPLDEIAQRSAASPVNSGPALSAASTPATKPAAASVPAAAPVPAPKPKDWSFDLQAGVDLGFGTTDRQLYNSRGHAVYAHQKLRNTSDLMFAFGKSAGIKSADRLDASMKTDYDLKGRLFLYNLGGAGYDNVRHIDLRYEVGPGLGYHVLRGESFKLNTEVGANYQVNDFSIGNSSESFFYRVAEDAAWKVTPKLSIDQRFEFFPGISDLEKYRLRFEGNLRYSLRQNLYLNLSALDLFDNSPAPGITKNDIQIRSSVGLRF